MTYKEKIIASAYTGYMFINGKQLGDMYAYIENKMKEPSLDLKFALLDDYPERVRLAVADDFLKMIHNESLDDIEVPNQYENV